MCTVQLLNVLMVKLFFVWTTFSDPSKYKAVVPEEAPKSQVVGVLGGLLVAIPVAFVVGGDVITMITWMNAMIKKL